MALRDKLIARTQPLLPGESIRAVFLAQSGPTPYLVLLTYLTVFWSRFYIVVVTDQGLTAFRATIWKPSFVKQPVSGARYAHRPMGPLSGLWGTVQLDDLRLHVHKRYHKDVAAADAALIGGATNQELAGGPPAVGAGWYPDPSGAGQQRWWDGGAWTEHTSPS